MGKKQVEPDWTAEYIAEWFRWQRGFYNGCADPFWPDGCNLNLMRNHMIYYIDQGAVVPASMPLPHEVDNQLKLNIGKPRTQISIWEVKTP